MHLSQPKTQQSLHAQTHPSKRRIARITIAALVVACVGCAAVVLYFGQEPPRAYADPPTCQPPVPEPGLARHWEADVSVSTYSSVNTRNGNVFTAIPIVSWSGLGPDLNMMLYHNSAAVSDTTFAQAVGFNLGPAAVTPIILAGVTDGLGTCSPSIF